MSSPSNNAFVPLTAAAPSNKSNGEARLTVLTQTNAQPFRPLGQTPAPVSAPSHGSACEPRVTVQRDGDRVTSIQVHCSCGEVIELGCIYGSA